MDIEELCFIKINPVVVVLRHIHVFTGTNNQVLIRKEVLNMTSNQISWAGVQIDKRRAELAEEQLDLDERKLAHQEAYDTRKLELEERGQFITQQIAENQLAWEKEKKAIDAEFEERRVQMLENETWSEVAYKQWEEDYKDRQQFIDAYYRGQEMHWKGEQVDVSKQVADEEKRHNIEMEQLGKKQNEISAEGMRLKDFGLKIEEKKLDFEKYQFNESQEFRWADLNLRQQTFDFERNTKFWLELGTRQRENNIAQARLDFDREYKDSMVLLENKKYGRDTAISVGKFLTEGLKVTVPLMMMP